jgi:hypothetical protein
MLKRLLFLTFVVAIVLAVAAAASARPTADVKPTVFTDTLGDSGTASDITAVTVGNDDQGLYTFDVGFATPYVSPDELFIYLDTDMNASTGDTKALGAEYLLSEFEDDQSFVFMKWNGTDWAAAPSVSSIHVSSSADTKSLEFSINKSDMDNSTGFNFFIVSARSDASEDYDDGPSGTGVWAYKFQLPLKLSLKGATAIGGKAGGTWALALAAVRSDTGVTLGGEGTIACKATSGATKLALNTRAFVSGGSGTGTAAVCVFKIPKKLKGKVLHGTITVAYQGLTVTKSFTQVAK